jgi:heme exporter protein B
VTGLRVALAILRKDLRIDWRSRDRLGHMALFAALVTVLLSITLPSLTEATRDWVPALLWVVFLFSAMLGLSRSFESEAADGGLQSLAQVPCDRGFVFLGKLAANVLALFGLQIWTGLLFSVFLDVEWQTAVLPSLGLAGLGAIGIAAIGTLFSALATSLRNREFMLPLLVFPLVLPVLVLGSNGTMTALAKGTVPSVWWSALGLYDWVFVLAGYFLFDYVMVED